MLPKVFPQRDPRDVCHDDSDLSSALCTSPKQAIQDEHVVGGRAVMADQLPYLSVPLADVG